MLRFLWILCCVGLVTGLAFAQTPTVTTDKADYSPGDTVKVTGTGWQAGERVRLVFEHSTVTHGSDTLWADVDGTGYFSSHEYVIQDYHFGESFLLTARGMTSGWTATTHFTDAETQPTAQSLPYAQDFSSLAHSSSAYPAGLQGWKLATSSSTSFRTSAATGDESLIASSSASTTNTGVHNYNGKIGILAGGSGSTDPSIVLAINTTGLSNITIEFDIMTIRNPHNGTSNTRINQVDIQYRVGTSGSFTSVSGNANGIYENNTTTQTGSGVTTPQKLEVKSFTLPSAANNQSVVQIRWVQRDVSGSGSRPSFAIDNISVTSVVAPSITVHPSNETITYGASASFTVTATGTSPSYHWQESTNSGSTWTNVSDGGVYSGATTSTLSLTSPPVSMSGRQYRAVVSNSGGSATSNAATLIINKAAATVVLSNMTQTYTGSALTPTATTTPAGLAIDWTNAPQTNAGSYAVTAMVNDANYEGSASGTFTINKATPVITWSNPAEIVYGTALNGTQLNATADVAGTFTYTPASGTVLNAGNNQTLHVDFVPTDASNYNNASKDVSINVLKATPTATLQVDNSPQTFDGTAKSATVSISSSSVSGSVANILTGGAASQTNAGTYAVTADFVPDDAANYNSLTGFSAGDFVINNPVPVLSSISPESKKKGTGDFTLTASGSGFSPDSKVQWNGSDLSTTFVSMTALTASVPGANIASTGTHYIRVVNPTPGGGTSDLKALFVTDAAAPVTASDVASGTDPSPSTSSTSVSSSGSGTVAVAEYGSNPGGAVTFSSPSGFFDVHVQAGSSITSLTITRCNLGTGTVLFWWDGSAWSPVSPQSLSDGCITATLNGSSSPSIAQLTGTPFAVGVVTTTVSVANATVVYSDQTTITATVSPNTSNGYTASGSVNFKVNGTSLGSAAIDGNGVASISPNVLLPVGTHTVVGEFTSSSAYFSNASSNGTSGTLTVNREEATATYSGPTYFSTSSPTSTSAKITLSATVFDAPDGSPGNIATARVEFRRESPTGTLLGSVANVGLVNNGDQTTGTATVEFTYQLSQSEASDNGVSFAVYPVINGNYTGVGSPEVVTISIPGSDNVSGGGFLVLQNSNGQYAGSSGSKNTFGFTMKYNKSGKNLQGQANIIVRNATTGKTYQIKSNAVQSLSVKSSPAPKTAMFTTKATMRDITNPYNPVDLGGNLTLQADMTDVSQGSQGDMVGFSVWNASGGVYFSSNWNGTKTVQQELGGGNISVLGGGSTRLADAEGEEADVEKEFIPTEFALFQNYPNPFNPTTTIQFDLPEESRVRLVVYDLLGREVATLVNSEITAGRHRTVWDGRDQQGLALASSMYFLRLEASSLSSDRSFASLRRLMLVK